MVNAIKQSGYQGKIGTLTAIFPKASIDALGSAANGILVDSQAAFTSDTSNPGVAAYLADVKRYASNDVSDASLFTWSAMQLLAKAIASATSFDAAGITDALKGVSAPINIGTVGPWRASGVTSPLAAYSRILNPTVIYGVVQDGAVKSDGTGFVNPFSSLSGAK
jgi:ABC-type branched-subunit amino acid transport system substrate-binding protein